MSLTSTVDFGKRLNNNSFSAALKMTKNTLLITIAVTDYPFMSSWTRQECR